MLKFWAAIREQKWRIIAFLCVISAFGILPYHSEAFNPEGGLGVAADHLIFPYLVAATATTILLIAILAIGLRFQGKVFGGENQHGNA